MVVLATRQQVLDLAPDAASIKAAEGLARGNRWSGLGRSERALWGECEGSGKKPYRAEADLAGPAFKCSCPSRKFPCKHALALLLLSVSEAPLFAATTEPDWVAEWLLSRDEREEKKLNRPAATPKAPSDPQAQARRVERRERRMADGVEELKLWLRDLVKHGVARAQTEPRTVFADVAARMVDAQLPGLARRLRRLEALPYTGDDWQSRFLAELGRLHALLEAYGRLTALDATTQATISQLLGVPQPREPLLAQAGERGSWLVIAQLTDVEERLTTRRTYLLHASDASVVELLEFAVGGQTLPSGPIAGSRLDVELVRYPGGPPQRVLIKASHAAPEGLGELPPAQSLESLLAGYADALTQNPWLEQWPALLGPVTPVSVDSGWWLVDANKQRLPLTPQCEGVWQLLALSGGQPSRVFGLWNGTAFELLSAPCGDSLVRLDSLALGQLERTA